MSELTNKPTSPEPSAVDDVRRIRARFEKESRGDLRQHVAESRRIAEQLREELGLKPMSVTRLTRAV